MGDQITLPSYSAEVVQKLFFIRRLSGLLSPLLISMTFVCITFQDDDACSLRLAACGLRLDDLNQDSSLVGSI